VLEVCTYKNMHLKISIARILFVFGIVEIIIFSQTIFSLASALPNQVLYSNTSAQAITSSTALGQASAGPPARLMIPAIRVNAIVEHVGITAEGAMATPKNSANVAWFNLGSIPGQKGGAVIAGHYGWENSMPAAFDNIAKLKRGDKVYVLDENELTSVFVVRDIRIYEERQSITGVFSSSDDKAHLNLITCAGGWDKAKNSYPDRLVVFTDRVE